MKHFTKFLFITLLSVLFGNGNAWGDDSYTITFNAGSGDGTSASTSTACSTIVSAGSSYLSGNLATATNVYYSGSNGLKLGTSKAAGVIKMNLASSITPTSIVVNAKLYNSSKAATLKVNGSTTQSITSDFSDLTFSITSEISYLQLESSKYCWIKSVTINYSSGGSTPSISANDVSLPYNDTSGNISYTVNNEVSGGSVSASVPSGSWITLPNSFTSPFTFTCSANPNTTERTETVTLTYSYGDDQTVTKDVTVTQAGVPTYTVTYAANGGTGTMTDANSPYTVGSTVTLLSNTFTAPEGKMWDSWEVKDASDNDITVTNGKFVMPASNVTVTAQWVTDPNAPQYEWVETSITDLTASDIFVIVGNGSYAMTNDNGTSGAPATSNVTISNSKITSTVNDNIKWNISGDATNGYSFNPNGDATKWLYCNTDASSSSNNNIRVGTGGQYGRKVFELSNSYLVTKDTYTKRYISIYNNQDWRGYTFSSTAETTVKFYKRQVVSADPAIYASNPEELAYDATSGSISYTINNYETGTMAASTTADWISGFTYQTSANGSVGFTTTANSENTSRSATVTLTFTYGNNQTITKDVTVTQAAAPVVYTTIPALFSAATSTETSVKVTFGNWVVSGVSTNGKNVFVTDGTNGFVIHDSAGGLNNTYAVGNVLSGTAVACSLKLNYGYAQLTSLDASDLTITTGGTVTAAEIAMANLAGVNTGALVSYEGLTCSVSGSTYTLTDGTTTLQVYTSLYDFTTTPDLEDGKRYNITGIYQQYNSTKEILPRRAADIVEVAVPTHTVTFSDNGQVSTVDYQEGASITLPTQANIAGYQFVGWTTAEINGTQAEAPTLVTSPTMGSSNVTYYAVYAESVSSGTEGWVFVGDCSNITEGGVYALLTNNNNAFNGTINSGHGQSTTETFVFDSNNIATTVPDGVCELTFTKVDDTDGYTIYNPTTQRYLYASNANSGSLAWAVSESNYWINDNGHWMYNKEYTINNSPKYAYIRVYDNTFRTYSTISQNEVNFAKKTSVSSLSNYRTKIAMSITFKKQNTSVYYSNYNLVVPENMIAKTYKVASGKPTISKTYETGDIVAQGTAVILTRTNVASNYANNAGDAIEFRLYSSGEEDTANELVGWDEARQVSTYYSANDYIAYVLSTKNGDNPGFYYMTGCPNGETTFTSGAHKVVFPVLKSEASSSKSAWLFSEIDDEVTGISDASIMNNEERAEHNGVYDLQGRKVADNLSSILSHPSSQKGIYIVNGKKVIIK